MSLFRILVFVNKFLEMITRDFLWGGIEEGRVSHLVKWEMVAKLDLRGFGYRKSLTPYDIRLL